MSGQHCGFVEVVPKNPGNMLYAFMNSAIFVAPLPRIGVLCDERSVVVGSPTGPRIVVVDAAVGGVRPGDKVIVYTKV